jgi:hypothetical protein
LTGEIDIPITEHEAIVLGFVEIENYKVNNLNQ